jgi:hypothetical protein
MSLLALAHGFDLEYVLTVAADVMTMAYGIDSDYNIARISMAKSAMSTSQRLAEAATEQLEAQKHGKRPDLTKIAELSAEKRKRIAEQKSAEPPALPAPATTPSEPLGAGKRIRRMPWKLKDA